MTLRKTLMWLVGSVVAQLTVAMIAIHGFGFNPIAAPLIVGAVAVVVLVCVADAPAPPWPFTKSKSPHG
jgi:DMSO/TMAO reductase YedYZ heme-binding membrane subunit